MAAITTSVAQAAALHPLIAQAAALGYPAAVLGFTPEQRQYWHEPGLPWWTEELRENPPLGYNGHSILPFTAHIEGQRMAPRFPAGCAVMLVPVYAKQNLVLGKVYTYSYRNAESGELEMTIGRLLKIGGNCLEVTADSLGPDDADRAIWLLREEEREAVWDVREVAYYVSYPGEQEQAALLAAPVVLPLATEPTPTPLAAAA